MSLNYLFRKLTPTILFSACSAGALIINFPENEKSNVNCQSRNEKVGGEKLSTENLQNLSHDFLLKQSVLNSVNSASLALTVAYSAYENTSQEYRSLLSKLILLMNDTLIFEVDGNHNDLIIATRSQIYDKKENLLRLNQHMDYVEKITDSILMLAIHNGLDNLANTLCERKDDALKNKERERMHNEQIEKEYRNLEKKIAEKK